MLRSAVPVGHHREDDRCRPCRSLIEGVADGVERGDGLVGTLVAVIEVEVGEAVGGGGKGRRERCVCVGVARAII